MSPLLEIRPLTPQEAERLAGARQEKAEKEKGQMESIEKTLSEEGAVALDFYKDHGGIEEHPGVMEQFKEMRAKILQHFRKSSHVPETDLAFDWTIEGDKGTLIVKRKV